MINRLTKFEMSTVTCNKDMTGNEKIGLCKNSRFELPFGDLGVTHRVHLWFDGKRIVGFLSVIIELFSLALTTEALLSEISRNRCFLKEWVTLSAKFIFR